MTENVSTPDGSHEIMKQLASQSNRIAQLERQLREMQVQINKLLRATSGPIRR